MIIIAGLSFGVAGLIYLYENQKETYCNTFSVVLVVVFHNIQSANSLLKTLYTLNKERGRGGRAREGGVESQRQRRFRVFSKGNLFSPQNQVSKTHAPT